MGTAILRLRAVSAVIFTAFVWAIAGAGQGFAQQAPASCDDIFNGDKPPAVTAAYN